MAKKRRKKPEKIVFKEIRLLVDFISMTVDELLIFGPKLIASLEKTTVYPQLKPYIPELKDKYRAFETSNLPEQDMSISMEIFRDAQQYALVALMSEIRFAAQLYGKNSVAILETSGFTMPGTTPAIVKPGVLVITKASTTDIVAQLAVKVRKTTTTYVSMYKVRLRTVDEKLIAVQSDTSSSFLFDNVPVNTTILLDACAKNSKGYGPWCITEVIPFKSVGTNLLQTFKDLEEDEPDDDDKD